MKPLTTEQQEKAIEFLTRVIEDRGYMPSEIIELLNAVKPKYYVVHIKDKKLFFYQSLNGSTTDKDFAKEFSKIKEAESFIKESKIITGHKYILIED
jgi:hypothetical protein